MISIIMPAFNAESFIQQAIISVKNQSHSDWELLIVDDGSRDQTKKIINEFHDARIKYFYQENQGVSSARNMGLDHMTGDYFCFLDADDYLPPKSLESRFNKLALFPDLNFADGAVSIFDHNLMTKVDSWIPSCKGNILDQLLSLSGSCFWGLTWMIRRNTGKIYRFNEGLTHGEDLLFFIELALDGGLYDYTEDTVLHYRKGHASAMKDLKGLEKGYRYIYRLLLENEKIPTKQVSQFKQKAQNIIFKSYFGNYQFFNAFLSMIRKW